MKMLTRTAFEQARQHLFQQGRSLDRVRYRFHFESGPAGAVLDELARYQNPDGGFGHALEPDLRTPASSAIATSVAFSVFRELEVAATQPLAKRAVDFLLKTFDTDRRGWQIVPPQVEDTPRAPWWTYADIDTTFGGCLLNPTASLVGALCDYAVLVPPAFLTEMISAVLERVQSASAFSMDTFRCLLELAETQSLPEWARQQLRSKLLEAVPAAIEKDPAAWATYSLQPLDVIRSPRSFLATAVDGAVVDANLDYWIDQQSADGSWPLSWTWAHVNEQAWRQAEQEWKGFVTVERLATLLAFGRVEGAGAASGSPVSMMYPDRRR
ncbi:MAG: hypothetical protein QOE61_1438 [Micromonosporaceae bacterium]|jgi:hypothetical protein|nr:hypothetical protein [Micromonosporaceae bacterium]